MASRRNDELREMTVEGSINLYDGQRCRGTAGDKGLAARLSGHNYNIVNNRSDTEVYLRHLRHGDHFVDGRNKPTRHFFGDRKRRFGRDPRGLVKDCLKCPDEVPRDGELAERRRELQLTQMENPRHYGSFVKQCDKSGLGEHTEKRYSISNRLYATEAESLRPKFADKAEWLGRRGEKMTRCASCPSIAIGDPAASLRRAVREDARKGASQRLTESANFATVRAANSYATSVDTTDLGRNLTKEQRFCSVNRIENHDFSVTRKNNHYSCQDKLTRSDPFFMRPRYSTTGNSVKYDILSNERKFFQYS